MSSIRITGSPEQFHEIATLLDNEAETIELTLKNIESLSSKINSLIVSSSPLTLQIQLESWLSNSREQINELRRIARSTRNLGDRLVTADRGDLARTLYDNKELIIALSALATPIIQYLLNKKASLKEREEEIVEIEIDNTPPLHINNAQLAQEDFLEQLLLSKPSIKNSVTPKSSMTIRRRKGQQTIENINIKINTKTINKE